MFHFGIQLPFYSLISPYLENRNSVELAACGSWGGFTSTEHLHWRIQGGLTLQDQVESPRVILSGSCTPLSLSQAYSACTLEGCSSRSHSQLRQGGRGLRGAGHSPRSFHHTGQTISAPAHTRPG